MKRGLDCIPFNRVVQNLQFRNKKVGSTPFLYPTGSTAASHRDTTDNLPVLRSLCGR